MLPLVSIFAVHFSQGLCCLLCLCFLCTSCMHFLLCHLEMAWSHGTTGPRLCIICWEKQITSTMVILGIKCEAKNPSLLVTFTLKQIWSSETGLSMPPSSPCSLERRWGKSAKYSQKIHLNSFLLRYTIWQVLLEFLDGKKRVEWEQLFWESFNTFIPRWVQCKSENYFFKEQRNFNKGLVWVEVREWGLSITWGVYEGASTKVQWQALIWLMPYNRRGTELLNESAEFKSLPHYLNTYLDDLG